MATWKVVYHPKPMNGGIMGVAFVEGDTEQLALYAFKQLYAGQYTTIADCIKFCN